MYHKQTDNQLNEVYELVEGAGQHVRGHGPARVIIGEGDQFHPTERELKGFKDKFKLAQSPPQAPTTRRQVAPTPPPPPAVEEDDDEEEDDTEDGKPNELGLTNFSSSQAHDLWVDIGKPDLSKVTKSGHGGTTYSKKDIEGIRQ